MAQDVFYPRSVFTVKRCTVVKVMSALREKTRRLWTSALFVILGPTALCLACGFLYWQRIPRSAEAVGTGISQRLRYEVSLERRERIRPNVQRFINVKIKSRESNENVLFIPEVYKVVLSDLKLLHSFAASFDNRGLSADADAHDDDQSVSNKNARSQNEISKSFSNIIYDSADQLNSYVLIVHRTAKDRNILICTQKRTANSAVRFFTHLSDHAGYLLFVDHIGIKCLALI